MIIKKPASKQCQQPIIPLNQIIILWNVCSSHSSNFCSFLDHKTWQVKQIHSSLLMVCRSFVDHHGQFGYSSSSFSAYFIIKCQMDVQSHHPASPPPCTAYNTHTRSRHVYFPQTWNDIVSSCHLPFVSHSKFQYPWQASVAGSIATHKTWLNFCSLIPYSGTI